MGWVDTHCHLQLDERDPGLLLERAEGVDWVVVPGVDLDTSQEAALLAGVHPGKVLATAGLHPHEAEQWPAQGDAIAELASKAAAIGETGLDFYRNLSPRGEQIRSFRRQIKLALELGKPIIVHCRDAFADVIALIDESGVGPQTVMHCWTGGPRWTRRFLDLGVMFSFAGPVAFETGDTVRLGAAEVPPERALVETDTPYLAPPPHRGQANEPAWVALVGAALARVWGLGAEEVAAVTTANAGRVFLPAKGGVPPEAGRGMFLPPKGGVPPEAGRGMFLPPKGGVPPQAGRGMFLPPKGGVPPEAGRGMFLPPKGGVPPQAGRGMFLPPKGGVPPQAGRGDS